MNRLLWICFILNIATGACHDAGADESPVCAREQHDVLLFFDRSSSANAGTTAHKIFVDTIGSIVDSSLVCEGDQIHAFLIHRATAGTAYRLDIVDRVKVPLVRGLSRSHAEQLRLEHRIRTAELRNSGRRALIALLDSTRVAKELAAHTDLWGSLEVASTEFASAPASAKRRIYYFSDMFESMVGPDRRDFDRDPPKDRAQAREWAAVDADVLRTSFGVDPAPFRSADVHLILGDLANKRHAPEVKEYWIELLTHMGVSRSRIHYN